MNTTLSIFMEYILCAISLILFDSSLFRKIMLDKLLTALHKAVANKYKLDKEATSYMIYRMHFIKPTIL